jgi:hypothetical protein
MTTIALRRLPGLAATGLAVLLAAAVWPGSTGRARAGGEAGETGQEPARPESCCFVNPTYAGVCVVHPAKDETCAGILAYLNNPRSSGRTYCNNTPIRGEWRQVVCEESSKPKQP